MRESGGGRSWVAGLALLMGILFLVSAGSFVAALKHPATVVDPQYYSHGLSYGRGGGEGDWDLHAALTPDRLEVRVQDRAGAPVAGGRLLLRLSDEGEALCCSEGAPGIYRAPRRLLPRGDLRATLHFSRGNAHSTRKMVILQ